MAVSLRKAINDKCKDCTYDDKSGLGQWRQQVEGCTVKLCPLWVVRPMSYKIKSSRIGLEGQMETTSGDA